MAASLMRMLILIIISTKKGKQAFPLWKKQLQHLGSFPNGRVSNGYQTEPQNNGYQVGDQIQLMEIRGGCTIFFLFKMQNLS